MQDSSFSPTQTVTYLKCPTFWRLNREWEEIAPWKPYLMLGTVIGKGVDQLILTDKSVDEIMNELDSTVLDLYQDNEEFTAEALTTLIKKGLSHVADNTAKTFREEKLIGVELELGAGRSDLVTTRGDKLIVTDHKVKLSLDSRYLPRTLTDTETDWQMWYYLSKIREQLDWAGPIAIRRHLIVLTPRCKAHLHETDIKPEILNSFARGAKRVWQSIQADVDRPTSHLLMNLTECQGSRYGTCKFFTACHTYNRDPEAMSVLYNKKERNDGSQTSDSRGDKGSPAEGRIE